MARQPKAKTAYELLERVCEAIKAHPLSYCQWFWSFRRGATPDEFVDPLPGELDVPENECGTAYCRAGWIVAVHDGAARAQLDGVMVRANQILGVDYHDTIELFNANDVVGTLGSAKYVSDGIEGIKAFMASHENHLKARKLRGV